jgi:hypothetical protein
LGDANSSEAAGKAARGGRVVIGEEGAELTVTNPEALSVWMLAALGVAFVIIGLTELALLWWPLGFGNAIWEFGTLSTTFDSVPMWGLGAGLIVFAVLRSARTRPIWVRVLAVACVVVVLIFLVFALVYVTATPEVLRQTPPEAMGAVRRSIAKTLVEIVAYTGVFGLVAVMLWRGVRRTRSSTAT